MTSHHPFDVVPFSIQGLGELLAQMSTTAVEDVNEKDHIAFLDEYFGEFEAQTILVEREYVDHDYLDDYAAYYSKCFHPYRRFCSRLHFFTHSFTKDEFEKLLENESSGLTPALLNDAYLGFIVVKPLPQTFLGRTCLKTYPPDDRRFYPTTRRYPVHLFGHQLFVEAVAFQEQDSTVAMCATSALWSAFHGTGTLFHHQIMSPVEITRAATLNSEDAMRSLPNDGLTLEQMARAIRAVSLEPFFVKVDDGFLLRSTVYAYLRGRIPLLLDIVLVDVHAESDDSEANSSQCDSSSPDDSHGTNETGNGVGPHDTSDTEDISDHYLEGTKMGSHMVTLVGYSLGNAAPLPLESTGLLLTATRIDKLYAHDDQVGPYARMEIDEHGFLSTSWRGDVSGQIGTVKAAPGNLLIPLYNKVRIPFSVVHDAILPLDQFLEELRQGTVLPFCQRLEWDIYLSTANDFKEEMRSRNDLSGEYRRELLLEHLPRFLWRATALCDGAAVLDLLFDATDIENGKLFLRAVEYDKSIGIVLHEAAKSDDLKETYRRERMGRIMEWFETRSSSISDEARAS